MSASTIVVVCSTYIVASSIVCSACCRWRQFLPVASTTLKIVVGDPEKDNGRDVIGRSVGRSCAAPVSSCSCSWLYFLSRPVSSSSCCGGEDEDENGKMAGWLIGVKIISTIKCNSAVDPVERINPELSSMLVERSNGRIENLVL